ncbi:hypothetical protein JK386_17930 [Nocardioides sp. zg-536]|uniref:Uncharacterized protein n=1 Tax=Nocardioides faecalis TaxID=2803858 RepID=A0A938YCE7_9ACTN|nr:hypothetical protein [Nocardioides faecalis]MBM9461775.1 hypothetical protein [Nocardioides faecalis]QVI57823.1 hypothetical protein KG111_12220 [Nocardioides faecalis]
MSAAMTYRRRGLTVSALLIAALLAAVLLGQAPVAAAATPETDRLCSHDKLRCSVQAPPRWIAGSTHQLGVTGRPDTKVNLQAYRVTTSAAGAVRWHKVGSEIAITTNDDGWGSADHTLPPLPDDTHGGPVILAPAEARGQDLSDVLGAWTELVGETPELVGDGFATSKPVGTRLPLLLDHVVPGSEYAVERLDGTSWLPVPSAAGATAPAATARCEATQCTVGYVLPRGLSAQAHDFRLVDLRRGTPVLTWSARPDSSGTPRPVPAPEVFPALGASVTGSQAASVGLDGAAVVRPRGRNLDVPTSDAGISAAPSAGAHSVGSVQVVAGGLAALALLLVLVPTSRRRTR